LQFTATPFREDGKPLDGKIVFKYPLKKAQDEGYFKPIQFEQVWEFNPADYDKAVAERAVQQLRRDKKFNHILMARVDSVERAKQIFPLYEKYTSTIAGFHVSGQATVLVPQYLEYTLTSQRMPK
jgi:superfamily II DNA or RNA helicase